MRKPPSIAIIVPAFNEEASLTETLKSLKNQDYRGHFRIIVVDNNSSDSTSKVAKAHNIFVLKERKQGVAFARQKGFSNATEDIIATTDADTIVPRNWLTEIAKSFSKKNCVATYGPCYFKPKSVKMQISNVLANFFLRINRLAQNDHFLGANFAIKNSTFKKMGGFNLSLERGEDVDLGYRVRKFGEVVFNKNQIAFTSPRRLEKEGSLRFAVSHSGNYVRLLFARVSKR